LLATKVVSQEEYDERRAALDVAKAQVAQALENVYQARVALGLLLDCALRRSTLASLA
jgi:multidrug resistance efflux pump